MDQEIKKKWIDALRSGKYKQGFGQLRNINDEFCCLGVLCDIIEPSKWEMTTNQVYMHCGVRSPGVLSEQVVRIAELKSFNPTIKDCNLSIWNDENKKNFNEIADLIEESDL